MHACKKIVRILIEEQLRRRQLGLLPTGNLAIVIPVLQNRASILPVPITTSVCGFRCKKQIESPRYACYEIYNGIFDIKSYWTAYLPMIS